MKTGIKQRGTLVVISISMLMLSGCFNSSSSDNDNNQTIGSDLASQSPNSTSGNISDATALKNDLDALFGNADGEPVDIETGETLEQVFDRVRS